MPPRKRRARARGATRKYTWSTRVKNRVSAAIRRTRVKSTRKPTHARRATLRWPHRTRRRTPGERPVRAVTNPTASLPLREANSAAIAIQRRRPSRRTTAAIESARLVMERRRTSRRAPPPAARATRRSWRAHRWVTGDAPPATNRTVAGAFRWRQRAPGATRTNRALFTDRSREGARPVIDPTAPRGSRRPLHARAAMSAARCPRCTSSRRTANATSATARTRHRDPIEKPARAAATRTARTTSRRRRSVPAATCFETEPPLPVRDRRRR